MNDPTEPSKYRVERQNYSRGEWRVLHATTGLQVWSVDVFDHPDLGPIPIEGPVCFERKRDAVAWVAKRSAEEQAERERTAAFAPRYMCGHAPTAEDFNGPASS